MNWRTCYPLSWSRYGEVWGASGFSILVTWLSQYLDAWWELWFHLHLLQICTVKVLSEYPEGKMTVEEQTASLGETYQELVHRLDEGTPKIYASTAEIARPEKRWIVAARNAFFSWLLFSFAQSFLGNKCLIMVLELHEKILSHQIVQSSIFGLLLTFWIWSGTEARSTGGISHCVWERERDRERSQTSKRWTQEMDLSFDFVIRHI